MARERKPNESAIQNMIAFLIDLQSQSDYDYLLDHVSITFLATKHKVSQTAGSILKELGIIEVDESKHSWKWKANNPERKMALMVLDKLLQKRKPGIYTPLFPYMAKMVTLLEEISAKLNNVSPIENNAIQGFKTIDKTFEVFKAVTTGIYSHSGVNSPFAFNYVNEQIIKVTEDLLKQYNEKFK